MISGSDRPQWLFSTARACSRSWEKCWPKNPWEARKTNRTMLFRYLRSNFLFWFGGIFTMVGLIVFAVSIYVAKQTATRRKGYYQTTATTTGKHIFHGIANGDTYYIEFRYRDRSGDSHDASANTSSREYKQWQPGRPLQVNVSVVNADDAWPASEGAATYFLMAAGCFLGRR